MALQRNSTISARSCAIALTSLTLVACRIGGPAHEFEQPPLDASWPLPGPDDGPEAEDTATPTEDTVTPVDVATEAAPTDTAVAETDPPDATPDVDVPDVDTFEASACTPFVPIYCDPVHNTGCTSSRCDISDTTNTGLCVWVPGLYDVGHGCTTSGPALGFLGTDTCKETLTCLSGTCVQLCYCDADCPSGSSCNVPVGSGGFMSCSR